MLFLKSTKSFKRFSKLATGRNEEKVRYNLFVCKDKFKFTTQKLASLEEKDTLTMISAFFCLLSFFCWPFGRYSGCAQNLNGSPATSRYSAFENLYLSVVKNFGFTSTTKPRTSSTTTCKSSSFISVIFSTSLFHGFV
jgi:hypothetical protein